MKQIIKLALLLIFVHNTITAQKNMVPGYIIKANGDTTKGKIDDGLWSKNPTKINFSANGNDIKTYDAIKELQGFGINGKAVYVKKKIALDVTPYENSNLLETSNRVIISDTTLMLRQLVMGKVNLYFLKDNKSKPHFFVEKLGSATVTELIKHHFIKIVGSRKFIVKENLYNNQLNEFFRDNASYANKALNLEYTESSLSAVVAEYNNNYGGINTYEVTKSEKLSATVFLQIGIGQYGYNSTYSTAFSDYNFQKSSIFIPSVGVKGLFEIPSKRRKWSFSTDINYNTYSEGVQLFVNTIPQNNNAYFNFALAPQYSFYKNKEKKRDFYASAGFTWEVPLNNNNESNNFRNRPRFGYKAGVGYRIQKVNLELNYFQSQANEGFPAVNSKLQRFMFTVGYAIF